MKATSLKTMSHKSFSACSPFSDGHRAHKRSSRRIDARGFHYTLLVHHFSMDGAGWARVWAEKEVSRLDNSSMIAYLPPVGFFSQSQRWNKQWQQPVAGLTGHVSVVGVSTYCWKPVCGFEAVFLSPHYSCFSLTYMFPFTVVRSEIRVQIIDQWGLF